MLSRRLRLGKRLLSNCSHITTPIFYPNAKPHLGHLYSSLLCDVNHKWKLLKGEDSLLTTGTDEHGLKIQLASEKNGFKDPKDFVDKLYPEFLKLDKLFNISYTKFLRTTNPEHVKNVIKLWNKCLENGYIYMGKHEGWYSISDETFYPESKVIEDPDRPGKYKNTESHNEVIYQSEENYFFKLSKFKDTLIKLFTDQPEFVYPASKREQLIRELNNPEIGLQDLSISRPSSRLKWGIEVPNDPTQRIYVWFDALCSYISALGPIEESLNSQYWKNTTHVIGKDIIRFHALYWPSILIAAKIPLPKQVVVHSHWISNGFKMSKSVGNVVNPIDVSAKYGVDIIRWFLLENSQLETDGDFVEERVQNLRDLFISKWGNLVNRCCGHKFNIERAVDTFSNENYEDNYDIIKIWDDVHGENLELRDSVVKITTDIKILREKMDKQITTFDINSFQRDVWSIINEANSLLQNAKPWQKTGMQQDLIIFIGIEVSRVLAILCQPIIPYLSNRILDRIDISPNRRTLLHASIGADSSYGSMANIKGREAPMERSPVKEEYEIMQ